MTIPNKKEKTKKTGLSAQPRWIEFPATRGVQDPVLYDAPLFAAGQFIREGSRGMTVTRRRTAIAVLALLPAVLLAGIRESKSFHRQAFVSPGQIVSVENVNGFVSAEAGQADSVGVTAEAEVRGRHRREVERILERIRINVETRTEGVFIEADVPKSRHADGFLGFLFGRRTQVNVTFHVRVPLRCRLALHTVNGEVHAIGIQGEVKLRSVNGNVSAEETAGTVDAATTNGCVRMNVAKLGAADRLVGRTTNGCVEVTLPEKGDADVTLSTVNGKVWTDFPVTLKWGISGKRIRGTIGKGGAEIRAETVNGEVRLMKAK
jgi:hypothetical protein